MKKDSGKIKRLVIRGLKKSDILKAKKLVQGMWVLHAKNNVLLDAEKLLKLDLEKDFRNAIDDDDLVFLVATIDNKIVGTAKAEIKKCPSYYCYRREFYIDNVVVDEKFQRKGIATKLINRLVDEAKKRGIKLLTAKLYKFNSTTQKMFKSLGFEEDYTFFSKRN